MVDRDWFSSTGLYYQRAVKDNPDFVAANMMRSVHNLVDNHGYSYANIYLYNSPLHFVTASFYMAAVKAGVMRDSDFFLTFDLLYFASPEKFEDTVFADMRIFTMTLVNDGLLDESDHESAATRALNILKLASTDRTGLLNLSRSINKLLGV